MDYSAMAKAAAAYLKAEIRKDAANLYSLKADWTLPPVREAVPDFSDEAFEIVSDGTTSIVTVKAFESTPEDPVCDGASLAPDKIMGVNVVPAALFHDRWYGHLEILSDAWDWAPSRVRALGDRIFASIVLAENNSGALARFWATVYYRAVRVFGGIYHRYGARALRAATAVTLCCLMAGCSGCVGSVFEDDGDGYESPVYEQVGD